MNGAYQSWQWGGIGDGENYNWKSCNLKRHRGYFYALNADTILREQIRQRDKAIRDYENDMAVASAKVEAKGRTEECLLLLKLCGKTASQKNI